jgi:hypothetical protein
MVWCRQRGQLSGLLAACATVPGRARPLGRVLMGRSLRATGAGAKPQGLATRVECMWNAPPLAQGSGKRSTEGAATTATTAAFAAAGAVSCTTTTRTTTSFPTGTHHGAQAQWPHTSTRHAGVHAVRDQ